MPSIMPSMGALLKGLIVGVLGFFKDPFQTDIPSHWVVKFV